MRIASLLMFMVTLIASAQDEAADRAAKDVAALNGKWEIVSSELDGQPSKDTFRPGTLIVIEGNELHFTDGFAKSKKTKFKLNVATKPRSMDIGGGKEKIIKGIYLLEKNTLKLCLGLAGKRPSEFMTKAGDNNNLLSLRRKKP